MKIPKLRPQTYFVALERLLLVGYFLIVFLLSSDLLQIGPFAFTLLPIPYVLVKVYVKHTYKQGTLMPIISFLVIHVLMYSLLGFL